MALTSFNMYFSYGAGLAELTDAEVGRLIKGAIQYAETQADPAFRGNERYIWAMMKTQIDRDRAAYFAKCERNAANIRARYADPEPKQDANINGRIRPNTTEYNGYQYKDKDKDKDKDNASIYINKRFTPPSVDEVQAYCTERGNGISAADFVDYYASQKWKKANGRPVADWKACIRQWERKNKGDQQTPGSAPSALMLKGIKRGVSAENETD